MAYCFSGTKPIPEPMFTFCQLDPCEHTSVLFESKIEIQTYLPIKCLKLKVSPTYDHPRVSKTILNNTGYRIISKPSQYSWYGMTTNIIHNHNKTKTILISWDTQCARNIFRDPICYWRETAILDRHVHSCMKWRHIHVERVFKIPKTKLPSLVKQQMLSFWFLYHMCAELFWEDIEIYLYTLSFHYWKLFSYWWYWITFLMTSFTIAAEISWNIIALRKLKYNELLAFHSYCGKLSIWIRWVGLHFRKTPGLLSRLAPVPVPGVTFAYRISP